MLDLPARCVCGILAFGSPVEWARARVAHKDLQFQEDLLLLEAGIAETSALPSLGEASRAGNLEVVVARLHWGADPNERDKVHPKYTPLHRATCGGHRSALRLLLAARAAPNARDRLGFCVLHFAANQQTGIVADLIQAACDVNAKNLQGLTPCAAQRAPWHYELELANLVPLGRRLVLLEDIRFTQRQVNDSFSHEQRPVLELIEGLIAGTTDHRTVPLIRIAWHEGAFWSIDNRRLFCYKHCRLGRVLVEVCRWGADNPEFEMKWKNGRDARTDADEGRRAGVVQRLTGLPFPQSQVMNLSESHVTLFMDSACQLEHDEKRNQLALRRCGEMEFEDELAAGVGLLRGETTVFLYPQLLASQLRRSEARALPTVQSGSRFSLTFVVSPNMHSSLEEAWCALCGRFVGDSASALREHERDVHLGSGRFRCVTCGK
ncbi:unnamed protein product, partial [Polarella glacialis]